MLFGHVGFSQMFVDLSQIKSELNDGNYKGLYNEDYSRFIRLRLFLNSDAQNQKDCNRTLL